MSRYLQLRLKTCLQTILELEPDLSMLSIQEKFHEELRLIREYLDRLEHIRLSEEEIVRLEHATETFLGELRLPLSRLHPQRSPSRMLQ